MKGLLRQQGFPLTDDEYGYPQLAAQATITNRRRVFPLADNEYGNLQLAVSLTSSASRSSPHEQNSIEDSISVETTLDSGEPCVITFSSIKLWTNNFSADRLIGMGGFG